MLYLFLNMRLFLFWCIFLNCYFFRTLNLLRGRFREFSIVISWIWFSCLSNVSDKLVIVYVFGVFDLCVCCNVVLLIVWCCFLLWLMMLLCWCFCLLYCCCVLMVCWCVWYCWCCWCFYCFVVVYLWWLCCVVGVLVSDEWIMLFWWWDDDVMDGWIGLCVDWYDWLIVGGCYFCVCMKCLIEWIMYLFNFLYVLCFDV